MPTDRNGSVFCFYRDSISRDPNRAEEGGFKIGKLDALQIVEGVAVGDDVKSVKHSYEVRPYRKIDATISAITTKGIDKQITDASAKPGLL